MQTDSTCNNFGAALKAVRTLKRLTQEDFGELSSRTYVSTLERGLKSPTLSKIDELAEVLGVHPLTLLTLAYAKNPNRVATSLVIQEVDLELNGLFKGG
ncbi:helix-turn-helix domain-containing protein [Hydrogenophaga atypica]|uniref:Helix-turn-helix domain-containing protein n=1 Tax=Hydrogenophaga atypica TaxID=249409 RepID=A0ABW2QRQ5_9BURK